MDVEKAPLLEAEPRPSLEVLLQKVNDAKQALADVSKEYSKAWLESPAGRKQKRIAQVVLGVSLSMFVLFYGTLIGSFLYAVMTDGVDEEFLPRRVPLEVHIMSKCPDAKDCLHDLVLPAMQNVSHMVDFKLSYIGTPIDADDGVICKHGAEECLGNILELCAANLYPNPKIHLGFTMCMTRDYQDIPSEQLVKDCALEHGIDFEQLNSCSGRDDGSFGLDMLRDSVQRSADAGVTTSCTVRLDGKTRCIRDGGKWTDCDDGHEPRDLVDDVMELRHKHSAAYLKSQV